MTLYCPSKNYNTLTRIGLREECDKLERLRDESPLEFGTRSGVSRARSRPRDRLLGRARFEVLSLQHGSVAQREEGTLKGVLQLTYVARPVPALDP